MVETQTSVLSRANPLVRKVMDLVAASEDYNLQVYRREGAEEEVLVFHNGDFNQKKLKRDGRIPADDAIARIFLDTGAKESPIGARYRGDNMHKVHNRRVCGLEDYLNSYGVKFNLELTEVR